MSQSFFRFKQFEVWQQQCAMKVSTDACIQGAWTTVAAAVRTVLDIGAGTGLLSLMIAQRFPPVHVTAVEMEAAAAAQCHENLEASPFHRRLKTVCADIREFQADPFDFIICNPPFFHNQLLGPDPDRNQVRHGLHLTQSQLLDACSRLLAPEGQLSVLLPLREMELLEPLAQKDGWYVVQKLAVQPMASKPVNRVVALLQRSPSNTTTEHLVIYDQPGVYTEAARQLLAPFYLFL
jgi:tRNA1Val (adenine37-N6)-methyltransferase